MIRTALFILAQCTWGILQTFVGSIVFLLNIRRKHYLYHGAIITEWRLKSSLSMGLFCFVTSTPFACGCCSAEEIGHRIVVHEYGHSIQSLILGPFYLFAMAFPSMLKEKHHIPLALHRKMGKPPGRKGHKRSFIEGYVLISRPSWLNDPQKLLHLYSSLQRKR